MISSNSSCFQNSIDSVSKKCAILVTSNSESPQMVNLLKLFAENSISVNTQSNGSSLGSSLKERNFVIIDNGKGKVVLGPEFKSQSLFLVGYPKGGPNKKNHYCRSPEDVLKKFQEFCSQEEYERGSLKYSDLKVKSQKQTESILSNSSIKPKSNLISNNKSAFFRQSSLCKKLKKEKKVFFYLKSENKTLRKYVFRIATGYPTRILVIEDLEALQTALSSAVTTENYIFVEIEYLNEMLKFSGKQFQILVFNPEEKHVQEFQKIYSVITTNEDITEQLRKLGFDIAPIKDMNKSIVKYDKPFTKSAQKTAKKLVWLVDNEIQEKKKSLQPINEKLIEKQPIQEKGQSIEEKEQEIQEKQSIQERQEKWEREQRQEREREERQRQEKWERQERQRQEKWEGQERQRQERLRQERQRQERQRKERQRQERQKREWEQMKESTIENASIVLHDKIQKKPQISKDRKPIKSIRKYRKKNQENSSLDKTKKIYEPRNFQVNREYCLNIQCNPIKTLASKEKRRQTIHLPTALSKINSFRKIRVNSIGPIFDKIKRDPLKIRRKFSQIETAILKENMEVKKPMKKYFANPRLPTFSKIRQKDIHVFTKDFNFQIELICENILEKYPQRAQKLSFSSPLQLKHQIRLAFNRSSESYAIFLFDDLRLIKFSELISHQPKLWTNIMILILPKFSKPQQFQENCKKFTQNNPLVKKYIYKLQHGPQNLEEILSNAEKMIK